MNPVQTKLEKQKGIAGRKKKDSDKKKWTDDETDSIARHFATEILNKRLPGKAAIDAYLQKTGIDRKWTNVKDFIRNHYFALLLF